LSVTLLLLILLAVFGPETRAGDLFVSSGNNAVLEYDGTTGTFVKTFANGGGLTGPNGLAFGPNGDLFVSSGNNAVLEYNGTTGTFVKTFANGGGLTSPVGLAFGDNGDLFVSSGNNAVLEYNGTTGTFVKTFASGGGLTRPTFLAFAPIPEPSSLLLLLVAVLCGGGVMAWRQRGPTPGTPMNR
jgi:outer membrane protein assembly factor BamB